MIQVEELAVPGGAGDLAAASARSGPGWYVLSTEMAALAAQSISAPDRALPEEDGERLDLGQFGHKYRFCPGPGDLARRLP